MIDVKQILLNKFFCGSIELFFYLIALISLIFLPFISFDDEISSVGKRTKIEYKGSVKYIDTRIFSNGVIVLIFIIISAAVVAVNTFAKNVIQILNGKIKTNPKIFDIVVELIPLPFTLISILLTIISASNKKIFNYEKRIYRGIGVYLLIIALIIALVIRIVYILFVKKYINIRYKSLEEESKEVIAELPELPEQPEKKTDDEVAVQID